MFFDSNTPPYPTALPLYPENPLRDRLQAQWGSLVGYIRWAVASTAHALLRTFSFLNNFTVLLSIPQNSPGQWISVHVPLCNYGPSETLEQVHLPFCSSAANPHSQRFLQVRGDLLSVSAVLHFWNFYVNKYIFCVSIMFLRFIHFVAYISILLCIVA